MPGRRNKNSHSSQKNEPDTGASGESSSAHGHHGPLLPPHLPVIDEMIVALEDGDIDYKEHYHSDESMSGRPKTRKSVHSNTDIYLSGPMYVDGSVKSMGTVSLVGDVSVRDQIEAYGDIDVQGSVHCTKIKSYGNLDIAGYAHCGGNVKIFGQLTVNGHCEANGKIEAWGAVIIQGTIKCRSLAAYASVTTIGDNSYYEADETATVYGANVVRHTEHEA